jgi:hypothetical protein
VGSREAVSWLVCGAIALVLVGMVAFGGGGSSSRPSSSSTSAPSADPATVVDQAQSGDSAPVERMLSRVFTENDTAQCSRDMTPAFVRQVYGRGGGDPVANCIQSNRNSDTTATAVRIEELAVHGGTAQGTVRVTAGSMAESTATVGLVRDAGRWKLDHLIDLDLNRERLDQMFKQEFLDKGFTEAQADCIVEGIDRNFSDMDFLGLSATGEAQIRAIAIGCVQSASA